MRRILWVAILLAAATARAEDDKVERLLAQFGSEPTIREAQVAAIKYYQVSPDQIRTLRARARVKAILPGITAGMTNSLGTSYRTLSDLLYLQRERDLNHYYNEERQNTDYLGWNLSASWGLDRLLFNAEELDVMSLIGIQDGIQREVTTLYYVRRRLQIEQILNPPQALDARLSNQLRLEELTGLLDAYTGGYFTREIKARSGKRDK